MFNIGDKVRIQNDIGNLGYFADFFSNVYPYSGRERPNGPFVVIGMDYGPVEDQYLLRLRDESGNYIGKHYETRFELYEVTA